MSNSQTKDERQKLDADLLQEVDQDVDDRTEETTKEEPENDPKTRESLARVGDLCRSGHITGPELLVLERQIRMTSPKFSLVARTKLNYKLAGMENFDKAYEKHATRGCKGVRNGIYVCGEFVVRVVSDTVYDVLYFGQAVLHKGGIKPVAFTCVFAYSFVELTVEGVSGLTKRAWSRASDRVSSWSNKDEKPKDTITLEGKISTAQI